MSSLDPILKTVLVTGANGYIGNAVARSFVRAGWTTYGLMRKKALLDDIAADKIIPLLGSPADQSFLSSLPTDLTFDVIVSTTEQIMDYVPHYNDIISLLHVLAKKRAEKGREKPLVLYTSGCKDYGMMTELADTPGLKPHTEESPINPPAFALNRATYAVKVFEHAECFDAAVLRPTNVYGFSSSDYSEFFKRGKEAKARGVLELNEHSKTILHATHVDDCGDAYVALAEHPKREEVRRECFNISSHRFETLEEIAKALVREYKIDELKWGPIPEGRVDEEFLRMLIGFSQWTGSDKLRKLTGWKDHRQLFSRDLKQYRIEYEFSLQKIQNTPLEGDRGSSGE